MASRFVVVAAVLLALLGFAGSANAYQFGTEEEIHKLLDVDIVSGDNEPLFLGYKTSTLFVLLGVYVTGDGYVFGAREEADIYYPTSAEELAEFQEKGLLPKPLPTYALSFLDYLIGYSLWITIAVIGLVYLVGWFRKRGAPAAASDPAAAGGSGR
jgi:hypothetical protein